MRPKRLAFLLIVLCGACVSLEEPHIPVGGVLKDQRTVIAVFASPGPVVTQDENKAESAAKITPGLAYLVQSSQNDRDLAASRDLGQYLPPFDAASEFFAELKKALKTSGHPGKLLSPEEAELTGDQLKAFDRASDTLDWRLRYFIQNPDHPVPRNYETMLKLNDALVFEADLAWGVALDDQQSAVPNLDCVVKLFRVDGMHALWRHEVSVEDRKGARLLYDFKREPQPLLKAWRALLPGLAQKVAADYKTELQTAGLYLPPREPEAPVAAVAASTAPAVSVSTTPVR
jgi:hypothetical protein